MISSAEDVSSSADELNKSLPVDCGRVTEVVQIHGDFGKYGGEFSFDMDVATSADRLKIPERSGIVELISSSAIDSATVGEVPS